MEAVSPGFQNRLLEIRPVKDRPICFTTVESNLNKLFMGTRRRPNVSQQRWFNKNLYAFVPFSIINRVLTKVEEDKNISLILITPNLQLLRLSVNNPVLLRQKLNLLNNCQEGITTSPSKKQPLKVAISGLSGCKEKLPEERVSERFSNLIVPSRRESAISNFSSVWRKWVGGTVNKKLIHGEVM